MIEVLEPMRTDDDVLVDEFLCHLYLPGFRVAFCGIHMNADAHCQMHLGYGQVSPDFSLDNGPGPSCPACGAPICTTCSDAVGGR